MDRWIGKFSEAIYGIVRFIIGLLFACHGAQKLFGVLGGRVMTANPQMLSAGVIELLGGILIALGLWAGYAGFIASGEMAVAYFTKHAPHGFWPIVNQGELAVLYCFILLFIAAKGSGGLSLDALLRKPDSAGRQKTV